MDIAFSCGEPFVAVVGNEGRTHVLCVTNLSRMKHGMVPPEIWDLRNQIRDFQLTILNQPLARPLPFNKGENLSPEYIASRMDIRPQEARDLWQFLQEPMLEGYLDEAA